MCELLLAECCTETKTILELSISNEITQFYARVDFLTHMWKSYA